MYIYIYTQTYIHIYIYIYIISYHSIACVSHSRVRSALFPRLSVRGFTFPLESPLKAGDHDDSLTLIFHNNHFNILHVIKSLETT